MCFLGVPGSNSEKRIDSRRNCRRDLNTGNNRDDMIQTNGRHLFIRFTGVSQAGYLYRQLCSQTLQSNLTAQPWGQLTTAQTYRRTTQDGLALIR